MLIRAVIHLTSTAVYTVVGYHTKQNDLKIMEISKVETNAFFGGQIRDSQKLYEAILTSANQAMDRTGLNISNVCLCLATPSIASTNGSSVTALIHQGSTTTGRVIDQDDLISVLDALQHNLLVEKSTSLQICNQFAVLDKKDMHLNPVGLVAQEMRLHYHAITVPRTYHQQLNVVFEKSGLTVHPTIFSAVAGAEYALTHEEKKQGVCFIDIGAGTTSVCAYYNEQLLYSRCFSKAGQSIDQGIANLLRISVAEAEAIKLEYGSADASSKPKGRFTTIFVQSRNGEITINEHELANNIETFYHDSIFLSIFQSIDQAELDFEDDIRTIVLTGGGAKMHGLQRMLEQRFNKTVRVVSANNVNKCISICHRYVNDDNIKRVTAHLLDGSVYNALGALLYEQGEQHSKDEQFMYSPEHPQQGWFGRLGEQYQQFTNRLKRWM